MILSINVFIKIFISIFIHRFSSNKEISDNGKWKNKIVIFSIKIRTRSRHHASKWSKYERTVYKPTTSGFSVPELHARPARCRDDPLAAELAQSHFTPGGARKRVFTRDFRS